jgi:hypothetical protein
MAPAMIYVAPATPLLGTCVLIQNVATAIAIVTLATIHFQPFPPINMLKKRKGIREENIGKAVNLTPINTCIL